MYRYPRRQEAEGAVQYDAHYKSGLHPGASNKLRL